MKKLTRILTIILSVLLCICSLVACGNKDGDTKGTIAVVAKGETHAFWQAVKAGAEKAGEDYGYTVTF